MIGPSFPVMFTPVQIQEGPLQDYMLFRSSPGSAATRNIKTPAKARTLQTEHSRSILRGSSALRAAPVFCDVYACARMRKGEGYPDSLCAGIS